MKTQVENYKLFSSLKILRSTFIQFLHLLVLHLFIYSGQIKPEEGGKTFCDWPDSKTCCIVLWLPPSADKNKGGEFR